MHTSIGVRHRIAAAIAAATLFAIVPVHAPTAAQTVMPGETTRSVSRMLARLPYYGVFDFIAFGVDKGTVTLVGWCYENNLKAAAEMAAKRAAGAEEVANKIEVLPPSSNDDRIRWATFYRIYTDDFLSRYAPGGVHEVIREIRDERHFPGMQPVGVYPIHIVVRNGRTMLLGVVDNTTDRQLAEVRAREVTGVFEVENSLTVQRQ